MTPSSRSIRRGLAGACAALLLGGAAVGIAAAQAQPSTTPTGQAQTGYQKFIDALAKRLNVSPTNLETAISGARTDAGLPAGTTFPGGKHEAVGRGASRLNLDSAANAIGIPAAQLRTELAGKSLAQVAAAHGKSANDVAAALKNDAHTRIDQAVTAGRVPADQANTQKTQADQRIDALVNQVTAQRGPGGPGGANGFGGRGRGGADLTTAATAIGIDVTQLRTELNGKSLAEVATAHGKNPADVATALKNAAHTRVDQAVSAGKLTADQATAQKSRIDQRIDQQMNQVRQQRTTGTATGG